MGKQSKKTKEQAGVQAPAEALAHVAEPEEKKFDALVLDPVPAPVEESKTASSEKDPSPSPDPTPASEALEPIYDAEGNEIQPGETCRLVLAAFAGTEPLMTEIWAKECNEIACVIPCDGEINIREILEDCIANPIIADEFAFISPNTVPCSKITFDELIQPVVYVDADGTEHYNHRLPMFFSKDKLVELLASSKADGEELIKEYMTRYRTRPVQVGFSFGNYVTPVLRNNPCENVVIEGLVRRKYITTNKEGFAAIENILETHLLK